MIIKTKIGKSFGGCVRYLIEKDRAQVLEVEGVRMDSIQHMINDFNHVRKLNPDLSKAVWHVSVSFAPEDVGKVNEELMKAIARDYTQKFGLEQFAVIKHNDTQHEHFHIIANRVNYEGHTISDKFCAARGVELSHKLERAYGLSNTLERGKRPELIHEYKLHGRDKAKYEIYHALHKELPGCKSLDELQQKLRSYGITTEFKKQSSGRIYGIGFSNGKNYFKGSEIDKNYGINQLAKFMEQSLKRTLEKAIPGLRELSLLKGIIDKGMDMDREQ